VLLENNISNFVFVVRSLLKKRQGMVLTVGKCNCYNHNRLTNLSFFLNPVLNRRVVSEWCLSRADIIFVVVMSKD
jgi:hypothetical protein